MTEENRPVPEEFFSDWKEREALAEAMIPLIGRLYRRSNVSLYMYGQRMINQKVTDLMKVHRYVRQIEGNELSLFETFPFVKAISELTLGPAHIDVGKIVRVSGHQVAPQLFAGSHDLTLAIRDGPGHRSSPPECCSTYWVSSWFRSGTCSRPSRCGESSW